MNLRIPRSGQAAKIAKAYLASEGITLQHSQALELIARLHGYGSWQAMQSDKRFEDAPALKPVSSDEYDFQYERGSSVWIGVENISVYVKREDEGVVVDLFAKGCEDHGSLASTYLFYDEATEHVKKDDAGPARADEPARWFLRYDPKGGLWYLTQTDFGPVGEKPEAAAQAYKSGQNALEALMERGEPAQVQWRGNPDAERDARRFDVLQNGGLYDSFDNANKAHETARNLALSGAGGHWTVLTDKGVEVGLYLYRDGGQD